MSGAPEKRHTVRVLMAAGISTRRACAPVGTSRSHLYYQAKSKDDAELLAAIAEIRRRKPRWGVRRTHRALRRRGLCVNRKRIERLWREHGLAVPKRRRRRKIRTGAGVPVAAAYRNHVWTYDIVYDAVASGRTMKVLTVVDEFTHVALAVHGAHSISARAVRGVLAALFVAHGAPAVMRSDNGAAFIAADNPDAAWRWAVGLFDAVERLAAFPKSGRLVPELEDRGVRGLSTAPTASSTASTQRRSSSSPSGTQAS